MGRNDGGVTVARPAIGIGAAAGGGGGAIAPTTGRSPGGCEDFIGGPTGPYSNVHSPTSTKSPDRSSWLVTRLLLTNVPLSLSASSSIQPSLSGTSRQCVRETSVPGSSRCRPLSLPASTGVSPPSRISS